jgi:hypothetical protein
MNGAPSGVTLSAFGRMMGVSRQAVQQAVNTGRITRNADGTIDPETARRDWLDRAESAVAHFASRPETKADAGGANAAMPKLRAAKLALEVEEQRLRVEEMKGRLVDKAKAIALVRRLAQEDRDAVLNWPSGAAPVLAAALGVDAHRLQTLLDESLRRHLDARADPKLHLG